jgi:hypothetical protein
MATIPDEFEIERSRAAVTVACLEWLRCTGPAIEARPASPTAPEVEELLRNTPTNPRLTHNLNPPHPLWDRWIDE